MRVLCSLLCVVCTLVAQDNTRRVFQPAEGRRLALVIGNDAYPWKPLANPANEARELVELLQDDLQFDSDDIRLGLNTTRNELLRSVREFIESVRPGDLAFVYYSGHGVEVRGENYLLPVDIPSDATELSIQDDSVSAQRLLRELHHRGASVTVLILDACRDNPLLPSRSVARGLARMEGRGSLIVFATEAGQTASDNGLFTQYLLETLPLPLPLDYLMTLVSRKVARETNERQVPAVYGLLLTNVFLNSDEEVEKEFREAEEAHARYGLAEEILQDKLSELPWLSRYLSAKRAKLFDDTQPAPSGTLRLMSGVVADSQGAVIPLASVVALTKGTMAGHVRAYLTTTGATGRYHLKCRDDVDLLVVHADGFLMKTVAPVAGVYQPLLELLVDGSWKP